MIKPIGNRLLVKRAEAEEKTPGGIIMLEGKRKNKGKVVAIGSMTEPIKVGDTVLFGDYGGTEITVEGEEYLMMKEDDIFAIE